MISIFKSLFPKSFVLIATIALLQNGCATGKTKEVVIGMLAGGAVGAVVGHEFVRSGENRQYRTQNTIISAVIGAVIVGGALAWHYNQLQEQSVEISGQYARYRLCNPDDMPPELARKLGLGANDSEAPETLKASQVGSLAISLDDNTKWAYPVFRKRFLPPERGDSQVLSSRYIWEIMRPGSFVTRTQNPQYFLEQPAEAK